MGRKRFNERQIIETLAWQGVVVPCHRCKEPLCHLAADGIGVLWPHGNDIEREHLHELKLGGADDPYNCRYSHKACHAVVTNGTPATTAGSSSHRIAKAFEPTRIDKFVPKKKPIDEPRERPKRFGNTTFKSAIR